MRGAPPESVRLVQLALKGALTPAEVLRAAHDDLRPFALTGSWAGAGALVGSDPVVVLGAHEDPFDALDRQSRLVGGADKGAVGGGWIGYLGYQLACQLETLPSGPGAGPVPVPRSELSFYDHLLRYDQAKAQWFFEALWSDDRAARLSERLAVWQERFAAPPRPRNEYRCGVFSPLPRAEAHLAAVARAIEHIRGGDTYQVNVCLGFRAEFGGDPLRAWCDGVDKLAPAYGAYLGYPGLAVASFSPELFLRSRDGRVMTSPIKGTATERAGPAGLAASGKDRAENVMIIDLMRNDLGRICRTGSVAVPELFRTESHLGVWHLVSDVTGTLAPSVGNAALLRATFPPGSVTGAPKVAAMELIAELEATERGVYTGCIGIASPVSGLELSVAIRTLEVSETVAWLGVGGGVVADSDPLAELSECVTKAGPLVAAIGSRLELPWAAVRGERLFEGLASGTRRTAGGHVILPPRHPAGPEGSPDPTLGVFETLLVLQGLTVALEAHIARLATSVALLYGFRLPASLGGEVIELASRCEGPHRLRILVTPRGAALEVSLSTEVSATAFSGLPGPITTLIPVVMPGGLGEHKWQDRRMFNALRQRSAQPGFDERSASQILLMDQDGSVLESERANLFAVLGDQLCTPPVDGRILAGTTREAMLRVAGLAGMRVSCRPLHRTTLEAADELFLTSSVAGVLPVGWLGSEPVGGLGRVRPIPGPRTCGLAALLHARWQRTSRTAAQACR